MATSFKDTQGRTWDAAINYGAIKRVKSMVDIWLIDILDGKNGVLEKLSAEPILMIDIAYAVCKPQADAAGVSEEQFCEAMLGDSVAQATEAVLEGVLNFCPCPRKRAHLRKAFEAGREALEHVHAIVNAKIESGELQKEIEEVISRVAKDGMPSSELSASSPESLA